MILYLMFITHALLWIGLIGFCVHVWDNSYDSYNKSINYGVMGIVSGFLFIGLLIISGFK